MEIYIQDDKEYLIRHLRINEKRGWTEWERIRAKRTVNSGLTIVDRINTVSFSELTTKQYFKRIDKEILPFIRKYEFMMEGAKLDKNKFLDELDGFYQEMATEIKTNHLRAFLDLVHAWNEKYIQMQSEKADISIGTSYISLLMQQYDYLNENEKHMLCGLTTTGEKIYCDDIFPLLDLPNYTFSEKNLYIKNGKVVERKNCQITEDGLLKEYHKYGYLVNNMNELEALQTISQIWTNTIYTMAAFINEYTIDMLCTKPFRLTTCFECPRQWKKTEIYRQALKNRRYLLPSNGVIFKYKNAKSIQELKLKEVIKDSTVYLLYKLETNCGQLCGFYNTKTEIFASAFTKTSCPEFGEQIENFVLENYYRLTVKDIDFSKKKLSCMLIVSEFKDAEKIGYTQNQPIAVCSYLGGKQRDFRLGLDDSMKNKNITIDGVSIKQNSNQGEQTVYRKYNRENYYSEQKSINGYIRRLPVGNSASEQALEYAKMLGIVLEQNETYVKPFVKSVLRVK